MQRSSLKPEQPWMMLSLVIEAYEGVRWPERKEAGGKG